MSTKCVSNILIIWMCNHRMFKSFHLSIHWYLLQVVHMSNKAWEHRKQTESQRALFALERNFSRIDMYIIMSPSKMTVPNKQNQWEQSYIGICKYTRNNCYEMSDVGLCVIFIACSGIAWSWNTGGERHVRMCTWSPSYVSTPTPCWQYEKTYPQFLIRRGNMKSYKACLPSTSVSL